MNSIDFDLLFSSFENLKIGVVGDVMLDTYWWGKVDRISPEAPVPIVAVSKKEMRIGGAGNVALNLRALGAAVDIISMMGADEDGGQLHELFQQKSISTKYLLKNHNRLTTNKIRIISRNQHVMRLDAEDASDLTPVLEEMMVENVRKYISEVKPQLVVLEDYNKGVLTKKVIDDIVSICKDAGVLVSVDPKRKNFFSYKGVDIFKPNLQEAKDALGLLVDGASIDVLESIHSSLYQQLGHNISFITLSEKGVYYKSLNEELLIPTHIRSIADVSGAGDTVIAVASLVYAATGDVRLMAEMANIAGGLVCEEVGTVAINKDKLIQECKRLLN